MPLQEEHVRFDEEIQRLEQEREDLAIQLAGLEDDNPVANELAERGQTIDSYLQGLYWARDQAASDENVPVWDADVDGITLAGLTGGEFGQVEDEVVSDTIARGDDRVGEGALRVYYVAKGTVDAPYVDDGMEFEQQVAAVSQLPITFLKWANNKVDDLTTVGGNLETSFGELLAETSSEQDSE